MIENFVDIFWPQMLMLTAVYMLVLVMIFLDLWSGVRKARQRGELRSSYGYRETVKKIAQYYNTLFCVTVIDVIQMLAVWQFDRQAGHHLPVLPALTFAYAIFIGLIEVKSIYEKSEDKEKARAAEAAAMLRKALKDRDTKEFAAAVIDYMDRQKNPRNEPPQTIVDYRFQHSHNFDEE